MAVTFQQVAKLDAALSRAGHPALSPFWSATIDRFLSSDRRTLVVRAGRRSGKSLTACKVGVGFALLGRWTVPPGEVASIVILSVSIAEAQSKLKIVAAMLRALGVQVARETSTEIELEGRPIVFRCVAASARTSVEFDDFVRRS